MKHSTLGTTSPDDFYPDAPVRLVSFYLPLPAPIVTPGESTLTVDLGEPGPQIDGLDMRITDDGPSVPNQGNRFVSIRLLQVSADVEIWGIPSAQFMAVVRDKNPQLGWPEETPRAPVDAPEMPQCAFTIAECVTTLKAEHEDPVSEAFDRCLESLAELSRAHRLLNRVAVPVVSYESLPMMLPYVLRAFEAATSEPHYLMGAFLLHPGAPFGLMAEELSPDNMERLMAYFGSLKEGHPGIPYSELRLESRLAHERQGAYRQSVVLANTAVEVLLDTVLALMLWEEGSAPEDAAATVFSGYVSARVASEFHPRLGGNWQAAGSGPVGRYLNELAPLRHRTVHLGYVPTQAESATAQEIASLMEDHLAERLLAKKNKYKTTVCLYFGLRGLAKQGQLSAGIRKHVATAGVDSWLSDFNAWHKTVIDEISRARGMKVGT